MCDIAIDALALLKTYHWPGNVRELKQIVLRAAALSTRGLTVDGVAMALAQRTPPRGGAGDALAEREVLKDALIRHGGNTESAARELGAIAQRCIGE
jgi:transcriptional regulator of acetoin/glycerol metabolism